MYNAASAIVDRIPGEQKHDQQEEGGQQLVNELACLSRHQGKCHENQINNQEHTNSAVKPAPLLTISFSYSTTCNEPVSLYIQYVLGTRQEYYHYIEIYWCRINHLDWINLRRMLIDVVCAKLVQLSLCYVEGGGAQLQQNLPRGMLTASYSRSIKECICQHC
ncbi:hypothetical protein JOB18_003385 [Solea senegalensis]|uniref:Uncharacterized protein n=1 Tax=Solea senegalensis TaxID=28829 RepID=A0AAV6RLP5_SOLSE|nr:hypothetical protein JOB18_003385 [Solea senegalensis]